MNVLAVLCHIYYLPPSLPLSSLASSSQSIIHHQRHFRLSPLRVGHSEQACRHHQHRHRRDHLFFCLSVYHAAQASACHCDQTVSVSMPASLPVYQNAYLFVGLPECLSTRIPACLTVYLSTRMPTSLSVYQSACLSACLHVCLSASLPVCLSACLPVCLSARQPVCLFACLPESLPVCLFAK